MNLSITRVAAAIVVGIGVVALAAGANTSANTDYIAAIERYDIEAWASYDSVDRHEVTTGADRGAQLYVYRNEAGKILRVVFDYGLSQSDALYCLLYKDDKLVKLSHSRRGYHSGKDGEVAFCQPYPEAEITRIYFQGSEVVCLPSADKTCEAIRSDSAKQGAILKGSSNLLRELSATKPGSEMQDADFMKYLNGN